MVTDFGGFDGSEARGGVEGRRSRGRRKVEPWTRGADEEGLARVADRSGFALEARKMAVECCEGRHTGTSAIC